MEFYNHFDKDLKILYNSENFYTNREEGVKNPETLDPF